MRVSGINNGQNFNNQPAFGVKFSPEVAKMIRASSNELSLETCQRINQLSKRKDGIIIEQIVQYYDEFLSKMRGGVVVVGRGKTYEGPIDGPIHSDMRIAYIIEQIVRALDSPKAFLNNLERNFTRGSDNRFSKIIAEQVEKRKLLAEI